MVNSPKVTLIAAIYRSEEFLDKLIKSLINQTYKNIEIILVDDGSPDNSGKICDKYASADSRIKVVHKDNGGVCSARNAALEIMTGDFVSFIDGDDWLEEDYVEYMLHLQRETGADMCLSDQLFTTRDRVQTENDKIEIWSSDKATSAIIYPYMALGPWNKLYSVKVIRNHNMHFLPHWFGEGLHFASLSAQYSNFVGVGHRKVYNYRLNNMHSGTTAYSVCGGLYALENVFILQNDLKDASKDVKNAIDWHIWNNYTGLLRDIVATNSKKENLKYYKECIKNIRIRALPVLLKSKVSFRHKISILCRAIAPVLCEKRRIKRRAVALQKDTMK